MKESFLRILNEYKDVTREPFKSSENELAQLIIKDIPEIITNESILLPTIYKVQGSVGKGRWTDTPWIGIFNRFITTSAQRGFYIVYLFSEDMERVYLSLNQGTDFISKKYKGFKPREKMQIIANNLRQTLNYDTERFPLEEIDLSSQTQNSKNYMAAHICGKCYSKNNMPSAEEIYNDLRNMERVYRSLCTLVYGRPLEQAIEEILQQDELQDTQFQNDIYVTQPTTTEEYPQERPLQEQSSSTKSWKRNPAIAREALEKRDYLCEVDNTHVTFTSNVTGKNFVEAHHLVPMNLQNNFTYSLDVPGNIVSLCPNCHRKIHHSIRGEKKEMLSLLYEKHHEVLQRFGIEVSLNELYRFYKC